MTNLLSDAGSGAEKMLRGMGVDALLSLLVSMIALVTIVFALQTTVSLRSHEASGIIEPQLAGAISRWHTGPPSWSSSGLPHWLLGNLPLSATPYRPLQPMAWTPLVVMILIAVALTWIGIDRFVRRDVQPG